MFDFIEGLQEVKINANGGEFLFDSFEKSKKTELAVFGGNNLMFFKGQRI